MPKTFNWTTKADVARHNKVAANDPALRKQWKKVANGHLGKHPDDRAGAVKLANGVVHKRISESSNVISDAEILSEFNFRSLGHNIVNRTLANLGSGKAQGRLDRQETLDKLMNDFNVFLGHLHAKPTLAYLHMFATQKFGKDFAESSLRQFHSGDSGSAPGQDPAATAETPAPAAPAAATPASATSRQPSDPVASDKAKAAASVANDANFYSNKAKKAGVTANTSGYQQNSFKQLNNLVASPQQDTRQIIGLTKEILAHANDYGGNDKARVMAYLKNLRSNPRVLANPKLAQMFTGIKLESIRNTIDMAMFLVENKIATKQGLNEAVSKFFLLERPFGTAQNASGKPAYDNGADNPSFGRATSSQPSSTATPGAAGLRARYDARNAASPAPQAAPAPQAPAQAPQASADAPAGLNANTLFSRKDLVKYFGIVAGDLLRQGKVSFSKKQPSRNADQSDNSEDTRYVKTASGRYKPANEPTLSKPAASGFSPKLFDSNLRSRGLDKSPEAVRISDLLRRGYRINDAIKELHNEKITIDPRVVSAMYDAMAGKQSR